MTYPSAEIGQPGQSGPARPRVRPSAWWYLSVVVLWGVAIALTVSAIVSVAHLIQGGVTYLGTPAVTVPSGGATIYSDIDPATKSCQIISSSGVRQQMDAFSFDLSSSDNARTLYAIASTPRGLAPGRYTVFCRGLDGTDLWYGRRVDLQSIGVRLVLAVVAGVLGLVALIVLLVTRHTSKSRLRRAQAQAYPGPVPGWVAPGYAGPMPAPPPVGFDPNNPRGYPGPAQAPAPPPQPGWSQPDPPPPYGSGPPG